MEVNAEAAGQYWYWVGERYRIWERRAAGERWPWTEDPILAHYRFCNVFRRQDAGSQYVVRNILGQPGPSGQLLYNIFLYRAYNKPETYAYLKAGLGGGKGLVSHDSALMLELLGEQRGGEESLYSSAYMLRGFPGKPKYVTITEAMEKLWGLRDALARDIRTALGLESAFYSLIDAHLPGWGEFTCYQVLLDLTYSRLLPSQEDINTWCVFGPGAQEGLREIWPRLRLRQPEMLEAARRLLEQSNKRLLDVPVLTLQDIEFTLCEFAKYCKFLRGDGRKRVYYHTGG